MNETIIYVRVANFEKMQHYKDRSPSWIKLYLKLAENVKFCNLSDTAKVHLFGLWMTASKLENRIPNDRIWLNRSNMSKRPVNLAPLIKNGFVEVVEEEIRVVPASKVASKPASALRREEKRREEKKEQELNPLPDKPARKRDEVWEALVTAMGFKPVTRTERGAWNSARKQLREADATPQQVTDRAAMYVRRWPGMSLTPTALVKHWSSLEHESKAEIVPLGPKPGAMRYGRGLTAAEMIRQAKEAS